MSLEDCVNDLLVRGSDDWVQAAEVAWVAKSVGGATSAEAVRDLSIQLIGEVVRRGLMEVGDGGSLPEGFRKWDLPEAEALARVEREWRALAGRVQMWEVCWLCITPAGRARGEALIRDGYGSPD